MKRVGLVAVTLAIMMSTSVVPAYAGEWKQDEVGSWYQNDDGSYSKGEWQEIDGKQYYFYQAGDMATGKMTIGNGAALALMAYESKQKVQFRQLRVY